MRKTILLLSAALFGYSSFAQNIYSLDKTVNTANNGVVLSGITMGKDGNNHSGWLQSYGASGADPLQLNPLGGNVGIGTTTPTELLTVRGNGGTIRLESASEPTGYWASLTTNYDATEPFTIKTQGTYLLGQKTLLNTYPLAYLNGYYGIAFATNASVPSAASVKMLIEDTGNVGIGTTTPASQLDIYHSAAGSGTLRIGAVAAGTTNDAGIDLYANNANNVPVYARIALGVNTASAGSESGYLNFSTINSHSLTEKMRITKEGNVGIGTTTPDAKLAVNGTIHSKEVLVNTTGFPDYVFNPTYHLPALTEVKAYIDRNHHLPDMPTEAEVVKNGLKVGETEALLTKKVEELTLYLIRQKEETDREITQLKYQISTLKHHKK
jgi:hypothetical protein